MRKKIVLTIVFIIIALTLMACRPSKAFASTVNRYATQRIALRDKAGGTVQKRIKRNTRVRLIREGKRWAIVKHKGKRYVTLRKYLNAERCPGKKRANEYIKYLRTRGPITWHGRKYTYYTSRLLPIQSLPVPGLHLDSNGMWCDKWDYIVLGSSVGNKVNRVVFATPFGKFGRVYDTGGYSTPSWLCDTAVDW